MLIKGQRQAELFFTDLLTLPKEWNYLTMKEQISLKFTGVNKEKLYIHLINRLKTRLLF